MIESESPGAVAALGASDIDRLGGEVFSETKRQNRFAQAPIQAELIASNSCKADDFIARGYSVADDRQGTPRLRRRQEHPRGYVGASSVVQIPTGGDIAAPVHRATWEPVP